MYLYYYIMKYQETTFEEYISAVEKHNLHPELENLFNQQTHDSAKQHEFTQYNTTL